MNNSNQKKQPNTFGPPSRPGTDEQLTDSERKQFENWLYAVFGPKSAPIYGSYSYRKLSQPFIAGTRLNHVKELEQQRDAALKLADKWEQYAENFREQSKDWLASLPKNVDPPSYIHDECAADLRAIFATKEGK